MQYVVKFDKFSGVSEKLKEADPPLDTGCPTIGDMKVKAYNSLIFKAS